MNKRFNIFSADVYKRSIILLFVFQFVLWASFGISYLFNQEEWLDVILVEPVSAAAGAWYSTLLYILFMNSIICFFIIAGNIFVRFGSVTPGLVILLIQAVSIGCLAGRNGFEIPFMSVKEANLQFLKIGFWETTAYVLACSITLPKSLYISNKFPAKEWDTVRKLKEIKFSKEEKLIAVICVILLLVAAIIETLFIV